MSVPERLVGVQADFLFDTLLPALRGHLGIRSGELTQLAYERGLTLPTGDPAARGPEWLAVLETLAGVEPLAAAEGQPVALLPVVRDLRDLVEGSVEPVPWWRQLLGGGRSATTDHPAASQLLRLCDKLADGIALPAELVRPLIGRFSGALTHAETGELAGLLSELGRAGWLELGARGVNASTWETCYDVLAPAAREAHDRGLGLLYDSGY